MGWCLMRLIKSVTAEYHFALVKKNKFLCLWKHHIICEYIKIQIKVDFFVLYHPILCQSWYAYIYKIIY